MSYYYNQSLPLNYTAQDDGEGINTVWYYVINSTNSIIISNITLTDNTTFSVPRDDSYTLFLWANDSSDNFNFSSVTFQVITTKPAIVLNHPTSNSYLRNNTVFFNVTPTYSKGLTQCQLIGNWSGGWVSKYTWNTPVNNSKNSINLTILDGDGSYKWNVWCKGTDNTENYALNNLTFTIDTIYPNASIDSITTNPGSQTIYFNVSANDTHLRSCKYTIFKDDGSIEGTSNVTISCNARIGPLAVLGFNDYNLTFYAIDFAGFVVIT